MELVDESFQTEFQLLTDGKPESCQWSSGKDQKLLQEGNSARRQKMLDVPSQLL